MAKQPKIRFKGFTEEWKEAPLGQLVKEHRVSNQFVHHQNLLSLSYGKIVRRDIHANKGLLPASFDTYQIIDKDTIVFRVTDLQNDKRSLRVAISGEEGIISPAYVCVDTISDEITASFLHQILHYHDVITKIYYKMGDGLRQTLNYSDLKSLNIVYPNPDEQKTIASIFDSIDSTITNRETELEKLKNIKRALLEKLFPQDGQSIPAIRFKGFVDKWEPKVLGNEIEETGTKNRNNLPLESYSITNEAGFIPQTEKFENGGYLTDADKTMYTIVPPKSFAYNPARINVGSIGYYNGTKDVIVSSLYIVFKTSEAIHDDFLMAWFKSDIFNHLIYKLQEGGVRQYFFYDKIVQCPILLPKNPEQEKIAKLVNSLNKTISLRERQLTLLKHSKQALLEQMFVNN